MRTPRKRVSPKGDRGFESHPLRRIMPNLNVIYLRIAGSNLKIKFTPPYKKTDDYYFYNKLRFTIADSFRGFIVDGKPKKIDYEIELIKRNIVTFPTRLEDKTIHSLNLYVQEGNKITSYQHISFSHIVMLLKQIITELSITKRFFLLHASASRLQDQALVFTGRSNAGKSTTMSLLRKTHPPLADDSVIIKKEKGKYYLYQTPFVEKNEEIERTNKRYGIKKLFFLRKAKDFRIEKIENKDFLFSRLTNLMLTNKKSFKENWSTLNEFVQEFDEFYYLFFAKEPEGLSRLMLSVSS